MTDILPALTRDALNTNFASGEAPLVDGFGRVHRDLRVSLTDRCSLRCTYCMPELGLNWLAKAEILSAEEIQRIVRVLVAAGVSSVRLTGGEPLLRPDLVDIVAGVAALETPDGTPVEVSMTTNGIGLAAKLDDLITAGLGRVNISLDTMQPERFVQLTRRDRLDDVFDGIRAASASSLRPLKLNAVAMRGVNDDELVDLVEFAQSVDAQMRFIEQMPLDLSHTWSRENMLSREEIIDALSTRFILEPVPERDSRPAERFTLDGGPHQVGIIASVTAPFCSSCDRLRLTADGQLRNCLFAREESNLRDPLRDGATEAELTDCIRLAVRAKRAGHGIDNPEFVQPERGMNAIGG